MDSDMAKKNWEMANDVQQMEDMAAMDQIYAFDEEQDRQSKTSAPWLQDPHHFKKVKISSVALVKMVTHAKSGGDIEVMGIMQGKVTGDTMVVMDAFPIPVEGTETRVNAHDEGYEFMVGYMDLIKRVNRPESMIGWYHSHPGYGCWLSGIDVSTQRLHQEHEDPYVAVVIDPVRTQMAGKVELGAFRTYPEGHKPPSGSGGVDDSGAKGGAVGKDSGTRSGATGSGISGGGSALSTTRNIPIEKVEDFGVHANQYYQLEVSYFISSMDKALFDALWVKYWVSSLQTTSLLANNEYLVGQTRDVATKMEQLHSKMQAMGRVGYFMPDGKRKDADQMARVVADAQKISVDAISGLSNHIIKQIVFNYRPGQETVQSPENSSSVGQVPQAASVESRSQTSK
eukprot:Clim_evm49s214 gene=Clim_evmTU49s214